MSESKRMDERESVRTAAAASVSTNGAGRPTVDAEDQHSAEEARFVAALLPSLRAVERLSSHFDERVMSVVRSEAPRLYPADTPREGEPGWWRRPLVIQVPRLAGLAMAAGLVGMVFAGALTVTRAGLTDRTAASVAVAPVSRTDTVHVVRFVFVDPQARSVSLVGDFNGWSRDQIHLESLGADGAWAASIALPPGRHEYAFLVNGERWVADPLAPVVVSEFDIESSVVMVGSPLSPSI